MKNFFDCKNEKITEKAFSQSMLISVLSILLCIVALCSMTYAWFTGGISSNSNTLTSGSFDVKVEITPKDAEAQAIFADGKYTLTKAGTYTVKLEPSDDATVKGHCIVKINGVSYGTDVILDDDMLDETYKTPTSPLTFTIVTNKADTVVTFEAHWGVLVKPDIKKDTTISAQTQPTTEGSEATETE